MTRLQSEDRDARWAELADRGTPTYEIAWNYGVTDRAVRYGIARHRARVREAAGIELPLPTGPLRITPLYGPAPYTTKTTCQDIHPNGPIPRGSMCMCEACNQTGIDGTGLMINHPDYDRSRTEPDKRRKGPAKFKPRVKAKSKRLRAAVA